MHLALAGGPVGHITLRGTQPQPVAHILDVAPTDIGTPAGAKGAVWSHDRFMKQRVDVVWMEVTVVLVT